MNLLELIDKRKQASEKLQTLTTTVKTIEKRKFTEDEEVQFNELEVEIKEIDIRIEKLENEERNINKQTIKNTKTMKEFRLLNAIRAKVEERNFDEASQELINAGIEEMRKVGHNITSNSICVPFEMRTISGQEAVDNIVFDLLTPLRNKLVLTQAGAQVLSGLTGSGAFALLGDTTAYWKGETKNADNDSIIRAEIKPRFISAKTTIDKQWLTQTSQSVEGMIKDRILNAIAQKLEATILGNGIGNEYIPAGLLGGISATKKPAVNGVVSFDNIVALETAVDSANGINGTPVYITNAKGRGLLKTANKGAKTDTKICENSEINGYKLICSNNVPSIDFGDGVEQPVIFGNFSDLVIAQWGGLEIVVDPLTKAENGEIVLTATGLFDIAKRHNESFAIGTIK